MSIVKTTGPSTNWGHPVAYHPMLSHFFESVNAAIFFCQLRYWSERTVSPLGVYKTSEEWTAETGLSYREQATARRILSEPGFVVETNKRLSHRLYFLIDWAVFNLAFEVWTVANPPAPITQSPNNAKRISPNDENAIGGVLKRRSSISTETTTETTAEKESAGAPPLDIPASLLVDFLVVRKAKRAGPMTRTVIAGLQREADKAGITLTQAVTACCEFGWQGFNAGWYADRQGTGKTPVGALNKQQALEASNNAIAAKFIQELNHART